jgi:hypothetical protein
MLSTTFAGLSAQDKRELLVALPVDKNVLED